jgi:DNA-binding NarL/FixJ family response regulator
MARILIADDAPQIRSYLKKALSEVPGYVVCGEAENGKDAVSMAAKLSPDLVILDFAMPILDGIEAAREIVKINPGVPLVLYTLHKNSHLEFEAAKVGIRKVFGKGDDFELLMDGIAELLAPPPLGPLRLVTENPHQPVPPESPAPTAEAADSPQQASESEN